jgi:hypothetical protein
MILTLLEKATLDDACRKKIKTVMIKISLVLKI